MYASRTLRGLAVLIAMLTALAVVGATMARVAVRPLTGPALLAIDRKAGFRNFLPTRMLPGFTYSGWSYRNGVLRVNFRNKAGWVVTWRVEPMTGSCDRGKQGSFQLDGNKVWWAQNSTSQSAWRCVFGQDGKPLRLVASTTVSPRRLAGSGLGTVAASARRY